MYDDDRKPKTSKEEMDRMMKEFLEKGGKVQKLEPGYPIQIGSLDKSKKPQWTREEIKEEPKEEIKEVKEEPKEEPKAEPKKEIKKVVAKKEDKQKARVIKTLLETSQAKYNSALYLFFFQNILKLMSMLCVPLVLVRIILIKIFL